MSENSQESVRVCNMAEDTSDIDEDFLDALVLLHSTDSDSEEKLRRMLEMTIQRKYGFEKTLTARMPKRFLQNSKIRGRALSNMTEREDFSYKRTYISKKNRNISVSNATTNNWISTKTFDTESEDYSEKEDIPTISIPDEGSTDGLLCKICNGAKLGPLILLECQDCQEVYHPLCHQPPVVDIDVYDPRIVWHCSKCVDAATANSSAKQKKFRQKEISVIDALEEADENLSRKEVTVVHRESKDYTSKTVGSENILLTNNDSQLLQKTMKSSTSNQLRRRIGSKLSVTRSINKR